MQVACRSTSVCFRKCLASEVKIAQVHLNSDGSLDECSIFIPNNYIWCNDDRSHSVFFDSSALNHFSDSIKIKLKSIVNFTGQSTILILNIGVPFPFLARRSMISSCICFCIYASVVSTLLQFFCNELKLSLLESKIHFFSSAGSFNFGQVALLGSLKWFVSPL